VDCRSIAKRRQSVNRKFSDLTGRDLTRLPSLCFDHSRIGEEIIYMHLYNDEKMHWYLAEYGPINRRFFGFYLNKADGIASGFCDQDDILFYDKKGARWTPVVDEDWKPVLAREIPILVEYIRLMILQPDLT
jgi:hypothetical protein